MWSIWATGAGAASPRCTLRHPASLSHNYLTCSVASDSKLLETSRGLWTGGPASRLAPSRPAQRATGEKKERPCLFQKCGKPDHRHYGSVSFRCRSATLGLRQAQRTRPSIGPTAAAWQCVDASMGGLLSAEVGVCVAVGGVVSHRVRVLLVLERRVHRQLQHTAQRRPDLHAHPPAVRRFVPVGARCGRGYKHRGGALCRGVQRGCRGPCSGRRGPEGLRALRGLV